MKKRWSIGGLQWTTRELIVICLLAIVIIAAFVTVTCYFEVGFGLAILSGFAALAAAIAAMISLKWARDTIRTFVTVTNAEFEMIDIPQIHNKIYLTLRNTGVLPAENISITSELIEVSGDGRDKNLLPPERKQAGLLFPNHEFGLFHPVKQESLGALSDGRVKIRVTIDYESSRKKCRTVVCLAIDKVRPKVKPTFTPINKEQSWY